MQIILKSICVALQELTCKQKKYGIQTQESYFYYFLFHYFTLMITDNGLVLPLGCYCQYCHDPKIFQ